jgi:hypothetical protein
VPCSQSARLPAMPSAAPTHLPRRAIDARVWPATQRLAWATAQVSPASAAGQLPADLAEMVITAVACDDSPERGRAIAQALASQGYAATRGMTPRGGGGGGGGAGPRRNGGGAPPVSSELLQRVVAVAAAAAGASPPSGEVAAAAGGGGATQQQQQQRRLIDSVQATRLALGAREQRALAIAGAGAGRGRVAGVGGGSAMVVTGEERSGRGCSCVRLCLCPPGVPAAGRPNPAWLSRIGSESLPCPWRPSAELGAEPVAAIVNPDWRALADPRQRLRLAVQLPGLGEPLRGRPAGPGGGRRPDARRRWW